MNISDAIAYQDSFDAVTSGSASQSQCDEVAAIAHSLGAYLREAALRATALPERRAAFEALLSDEGKAALAVAFPVDLTAMPRVTLDASGALIVNEAQVTSATAAPVAIK